MKRSVKKIIGNTLFLAGALLVLASFIILIKQKTEEREALKAGNEGVDLILAHIQSVEKENASGKKENGKTREPETESADTKTNPSGRVYVYEEYASQMPVYSAGMINYIGIVEVPSVGICLPVTDGWNVNTLKKAPCRYYGTVDDNNLVIAGHNYKNGQFGDLKRVTAGDKVYFTKTDGERVPYTIRETEILNPTDVIPMVESEFDLTLYTCTYGGKTRFTVRCVKDE